MKSQETQPETCPRCAWAAGEIQSLSDVLADSEERVKDLEAKIRWVLNDAAYTAPEDRERQARQWRVLRDAVSPIATSTQEGGASE